MPHKSLETFILRSILCVFKTDYIDFEQMNVVQFELYLEIYTAANI